MQEKLMEDKTEALKSFVQAMDSYIKNKSVFNNENTF